MSETTTTTTLDVVVDTWLEAYAEPDPARRAQLAARSWSSDAYLADPPFEGQSREEIVALGDVVLSHFPGHRFRRTTAIDAHHGFARYGWALEAADGTLAVAGVDVVQVDDAGRLRRVVGFFGELPPLG
jgi:hypothetical protein